MDDRGNVPTPDEVDSWASGSPKRERRFRRLFARRSIDVAAGVGEAVTKAKAASSGTVPQSDVKEPEARISNGPRRIEFAPGVLEHDAGVLVEEPLREGTPSTSVDSPPTSSAPESPKRLTVPAGATTDLGASGLVSTSRPIFEAVGFALYVTGEERAQTGPTPSEEDADGMARLYRVQGPDGLLLELGDISWENGERSLMVLDRVHAPARFDGLVGRLRMTVQSVVEGLCVELSAAGFSGTDRPSLRKADVPAMSWQIGIDIVDALSSVGATAVGTKEEVLGVRHQRRDYWCVVFDEDALHVAAVAFLLMRILPVHLELQL
jgi:hypothetical protein